MASSGRKAPAQRSRQAGTPLSGEPSRHDPVLLPDIVAALAPKPHGHYIDGTFGAGGYTQALLEAVDTQVLAIDRDASAIAGGAELAERFGPRLRLLEGRFGELREIAIAADFAPVDGIVLDIGVSSMQLDQAERGFSFMRDGPLDMRMARQGPSAADIVNTMDQDPLAHIIWSLGDERRSRTIASAILRARAERPIETTGQLAGIVARVFGSRKIDGKHPATRTFQALRIHVNDELGELTRGLAAAEAILKPGGRLAVVTFHSLEDRIVKRFLAVRCGKVQGGSRHLPRNEAGPAPSFRFINPRPVSPSMAECEANPRSRSARLRWAERTDQPPHALDPAALGVPPVFD